MNPAVRRLCSETKAVKGGTWIQKERSRREKQEKKLQRMRNTLSGGEGKSAKPLIHIWTESELCNMLHSVKSNCVCRLAQNEMRQQKLEDAVHEAQKPLARHYDDEDLDRMLREQEREGDPMAAMLRRKKDKNKKTQGFK